MNLNDIRHVFISVGSFALLGISHLVYDVRCLRPVLLSMTLLLISGSRGPLSTLSLKVRNLLTRHKTGRCVDLSCGQIWLRVTEWFL